MRRNANYKIGMDSPQLGGYAQVMDSLERNSLPMEGIDGNCCCMGGTCQWLGSRHEIRCSRVFRTDGMIIPVSIDAFSNRKQQSKRKSVYAEAYTNFHEM